MILVNPGRQQDATAAILSLFCVLGVPAGNAKGEVRAAVLRYFKQDILVVIGVDLQQSGFLCPNGFLHVLYHHAVVRFALSLEGQGRCWFSHFCCGKYRPDRIDPKCEARLLPEYRRRYLQRKSQYFVRFFAKLLL